MRKLFFLFLALVATTSLWAQTFQVGDLVYYITSSSEPYTVKVSAAECSITSAVIPSTVTYNGTTYSVTNIGYRAFHECSSLTSVTIPNSVTSIGLSAFAYCTSLTSITIPNSVTTVGGGMFNGCSKLKSVVLSNNITSLPSYYDSFEWTTYGFFKNCSSLTSIVIPNSVTSIGEFAFSGCSSLTSLTIPNSVTSIGYNAFDNCSSLTSVTIPNSVTSIEGHTFSGCSSLTSVTIPNSVTSIGGSAFYGCSSLTSIIIPNNVTTIKESTFFGCSSLTSVTIPNSVTSIGRSAFYRCSSLTSVTIGNSVTSIGDWAFEDCSSLTSITIPNSVTYIEYEAFRGCSSLTSVTIPNSVTYIGSEAFRGCSSLTSITIPENITYIGTGVFVSCASLTSVVWNAKNCVDFFTGSDAEIGTFSTLFYENSRTPSDNGPISSTTVCPITSVVFGDEVESIPAYLCYGLERLTSITIPNSVTSIGNDAFDGCSSLPVENNLRYADTYLVGAVDKTLSTYSIKEGTKWIGDHAFYDCSSLTSITIGNSVTSIGDAAFMDCSSLTSVTIGNSVTSIGNEAFSYCDALTSVTIGNSVTSIGDEAFYGCDSLATITIPNSVTSIGDKAFAYCSSLTSVTIPNSVTSIGDNAFYGCNISIILSASDIATFCQGNTNDLLRQQDITFPRKLLIKDVETKEVDIPNSVESIKPSAFYNCIDLNKVSLSNSVKTIGNSAFAGCTGLNLLRLGTGIQSIAANAFAACTKLYDIYCLAAEPPTGYTSSFANYNAFLYVPCESQRLYMLDVFFGEFKYIECISSDEVTTDDILITPGSTDVTITWPTEGNADTYTIVIKKDGEVVCTLTFNSNGQLLNIAFAPGRDGNHPAQYAEQAANGKGFRFTVTGLEEGTDYTYDITVKDASNKTIKSHSGKFTTESLTAVENTHSQSPITNSQKLLRDGQLIIIRDGVEYNAQGAVIN